MSKKEIANKEATKEIQVFTETATMGVADELTSSDVQIPSLMLMQANAELVKDRSNNIQSGDFVNSITNEVWGSIEDPLQVCVVDMFKTEVITETQSNNWVSTKPWEPEMESMPYLFKNAEGNECKRQKCFNYICFRPLDIREVTMPGMDPQYVATPFIVKFKGASSKNAKKFNQMLRDYAAFKQPSFAFTFDLTASEAKNEHGSFMVYNMTNPRQAVKETQLAGAKLAGMSKAARSNGEMEVVDAEEVSVEKTVNNIPNHAPQSHTETQTQF